MFDKSPINTRAEPHNGLHIILIAAAMGHRQDLDKAESLCSFLFYYYFCTSDAFVVLAKCAQPESQAKSVFFCFFLSAGISRMSCIFESHHKKGLN